MYSLHRFENWNTDIKATVKLFQVGINTDIWEIQIQIFTKVKYFKYGSLKIPTFTYLHNYYLTIKLHDTQGKCPL